MSEIGFGDSFIKWICLLYTNPRCSVMVNGHLSPFFFPSRGVRQGCPLSPLLYVLNMDVLACNIRASPGVQGITLPELCTPLPVLSLYAGDVSVITSSERAMEEVLHTYARFERGTGSRFDAVAKCTATWNSRNLSYAGRALISNALALARLWYLATMFPIPVWALGSTKRG